MFFPKRCKAERKISAFCQVFPIKRSGGKRIDPCRDGCGRLSLIYKADAGGAVNEFEEGAANDFARPRIALTKNGNNADIEITASATDLNPPQGGFLASIFS